MKKTDGEEKRVHPNKTSHNSSPLRMVLQLLRPTSCDQSVSCLTRVLCCYYNKETEEKQ